MSCYSYIMCLNGNGDKCLKSILLSFKALLLLVLSQKSCKCFPGSSFYRQSLVTATAQLTDEVFPPWLRLGIVRGMMETLTIGSKVYSKLEKWLKRLFITHFI